jgi:hypothetical protein
MRAASFGNCWETPSVSLDCNHQTTSTDYREDRPAILDPSTVGGDQKPEDCLSVPPPTSITRRNSIGRAVSLSSAQSPTHAVNFLVVPTEKIGYRGLGGGRRPSFSRTASLGSACVPGNCLLVPTDSVGQRTTLADRLPVRDSRNLSDGGVAVLAKTGRTNTRTGGGGTSSTPANVVGLDHHTCASSTSFSDNKTTDGVVGRGVLPAVGAPSRSGSRPRPRIERKGLRAGGVSVGRASSLNSGTCGQYDKVGSKVDRTRLFQSAVLASSGTSGGLSSTDSLCSQLRHHAVKFSSKGRYISMRGVVVTLWVRIPAEPLRRLQLGALKT